MCIYIYIYIHAHTHKCDRTHTYNIYYIISSFHFKYHICPTAYYQVPHVILSTTNVHISC